MLSISLGPTAYPKIPATSSVTKCTFAVLSSTRPSRPSRTPARDANSDDPAMFPSDAKSRIRTVPVPPLATDDATRTRTTAKTSSVGSDCVTLEAPSCLTARASVSRVLWSPLLGVAFVAPKTALFVLVFLGYVVFDATSSKSALTVTTMPAVAKNTLNLDRISMSNSSPLYNGREGSTAYAVSMMLPSSTVCDAGAISVTLSANAAIDWLNKPYDMTTSSFWEMRLNNALTSSSMLQIPPVPPPQFCTVSNASILALSGVALTLIGIDFVAAV